MTAAGIFWLAGFAAAAEEAKQPEGADVRLADRFWEVSDAVLDHHLDPPARQQMLLNGVKGLLGRLGKPAPPGLGRRVSELSDEQQMRELIVETAREADDDKTSFAQLEEAMLRAALSAAPGGGGWIDTVELRVNRQIRDNQYEGIGIQLAMRDGKPLIAKAFLNGPCRNAGGKDGDWIVAVDGVKTEGLDLRKVVDMLRGVSGEPVSIEVKHPDDENSRALDMVRGVIPFQNVVGIREVTEQEWEFKVVEDAPIAYVNIKAIRGSTVQELRDVARRLKAEELRALILDLRGTTGGDIRHTVMLADALMGEGAIGIVQTAAGEQTYSARAVNDFGGWPIAALIGPGTRQDVEWLAAALQDSGRATLVGVPTAGDPFLRGHVELPSGGALVMRTGLFKRAGGKPLTAAAGAPQRIRTPVRSPRARDRNQQRAEAPYNVMPGMQLMQRRGGVQPDHLVTMDQRNLLRAAEGGADKTPAEQPQDPQIAKAVELLGEALKKADSDAS